MKDNKLLCSVCGDLYVMTGVKAVLYNADMQIIYAHPGAMSRFCAAVRKYGHLNEECLRCDQTGLQKCRESGCFHIYQCHMGLTEAATPITDGGAVIGYLLFGQLLSEGNREAVLQRIEAIPDEQDRFFLLAEADAMPEMSREKLEAAARLMTMCACYIRLNNMISGQAENPGVPIGRFIAENLSDPALSIPLLTRRFSISRSTLYAVSRKSFGMGITEYIRKVRLEHAVRLLKTTDLPVFEIAAAAGFSDPDYMTRLLRKTTGKTPRQIRKSAGTP